MKKYFVEIILIGFALAFSFWLMFHTFSYNDGSMLIASKAWSDFASHIPLIRSFSYGANFPPEYPLFPGEPIRYHFLFYALVGFLEKIGLPIDYALNIPSALSFAALIMMIYFLAKTLFKSKAVGVLSVLFFLFNGSLSFLEFFKTHPLSLTTVNDILNNTSFPSFGPYDGKVVSAFWNLNIYTNQRHIAFSFALALGIVYLLYTKRHEQNRLYNSLLVGFLTGSLLLLNQSAFAIAVVFVIWFFILKPVKRLFLVIGTLSGLPWLFLFLATTSFTPQITAKPGFLLNSPLTTTSLITYWLHNLGFYTLLIPLGFFSSPKNAKSLVIPLLTLFLLPNIFQFSTDIINNHKFFNFFLLIGAMYAANLLVSLWKDGYPKTVYFKKIVCIILFISLTLSGIVDLMVIKNDRKIELEDSQKNSDIRFIINNTDPQALILNSTFLYHPASLTGRPIFYGYPYFSWSYGYDNRTREQIVLTIYRAKTKTEACNLLLSQGISYVELNDHPEEYLKPNWEVWRNDFLSIYSNPESGITLYDVAISCN